MYDNIIIFIIVGFLAQIIDGALGMAYGVSSTTFLLSLGISPAMASASVHMAEVFTTLSSGLSHLKFGNVDKKLFKKLVFPGILGGVIGAYILTSIDGRAIKPFIAVYLLIMGIRIVYKATKKALGDKNKNIDNKLYVLATVGGFCDAIGGGGWGPIVTSTLVAKGYTPRITIGSVNLAEFFVTLAETITFIALVKFIHWKVIIGLIIGGVIAAPFAALICKKINPKVLMLIVGIVIMLLSIRTILLGFI